jgi:small GTP-binding protein
MSFETIKVVLIGESGSGKTSIIQQFAYKIFDPNCATSISSQYVSKVISFSDLRKSLRIEIWDTAGQERYRSMAKLFYQDAKIIIFVYDVTSKSSFDELINYWIPEVQNTINTKEVIFGLVANKSDLYEIECITSEQGIKLADEINAIFQKTSAKLGLGISLLFENLGRTYLEPGFDYKKEENIDKENFERKKIEKEREKIREKENIKIGNDSNDKDKDNNKNKKGCC